MLRKVISCRPRTRPPRDRSAEVREALTAIETRRVARAQRMIEAAVTLAMREKRNPRLIADPKARVVDRIMQRWAVGHGDGLPPADPAALPSRPPPLDDTTQMVIDDIITNRVPDSVRWLVCQWYRTELPCSIMAQQRRMSVRSLYYHWELDLAYLSELFLATGHSDLVALLRMAGA